MLGFKYSDWPMWNFNWVVLNGMCLCSEVFGLPPQEDEHQPFPWTISLQSPQQDLLEDSKRWVLFIYFPLHWLFAVVALQTMMNPFIPNLNPVWWFQSTDLTTEFEFHWDYLWLAAHFEWMCEGLNMLTFLNRYASTQNQERSGCSGQAEGFWWDPSSLWQGRLFWVKLVFHRIVVELEIGLIPFFISKSFPQRKRVVVPAALKIVCLKPTRKFFFFVIFQWYLKSLFVSDVFPQHVWVLTTMSSLHALPAETKSCRN